MPGIKLQLGTFSKNLGISQVTVYPNKSYPPKAPTAVVKARAAPMTPVTLAGLAMFPNVEAEVLVSRHEASVPLTPAQVQVYSLALSPALWLVPAAQAL